MANRQQLYALIVVTFLLLHLGIRDAARVVRKQRMKIFTENIIATLEVSLTQCHLKCKIDNECIGYGTSKNTQLGKLTKCHLIRRDGGKYSSKAGGRSSLDLYVVEMDEAIDTSKGQNIEVTITTRRTTTTTTTKGKTKTITKSPTTTTVTKTTLPTNKIIATTIDISTTPAKASTWGPITKEKTCLEPYTDGPRQLGCSGWKGISLEECKKKCENSEIPQGCVGYVSNPQCNFMLWWPGAKQCHFSTTCQAVGAQGAEILQLDRGDVVAVNALSSSVINDDVAQYGPLKAWEGGTHYFHSKEEQNPWFLLELNRLVSITSVTIVNRKDCCGERLRNLELRGGKMNDLTNPIIGKFLGPGTTGGVHKILLQKRTTVKFLSIQLKAFGYLQINGTKLGFNDSSWGSITEEKKCLAPYTRSDASRDPKMKCDGWKGISLEDCKRKCENAEIPPGCVDFVPNPQCNFITWWRTTGLCHHYQVCVTGDDANAKVLKLEKDQKLVMGATCPHSFDPLITSWQDCRDAAIYLGLSSQAPNVDYKKDVGWGTTRPQGCFRGGTNRRFRFNIGAGGNFEENDYILCVRDKVEAISASSSSVHDNNEDDFGPQFSWKGNSAGQDKFFVSNIEPNPWLLIELYRPVTIESVTIINRKDCCGDGLRNLELRGGMKNNLTNPIIGNFTGPGTTGGAHKIRLGKPATLRFLSIQRKTQNGGLHVNGIRLGLADDAQKFQLVKGANCPTSFVPYTTSWEDCCYAALSLGFRGESLWDVYHKNKGFGLKNPQGCFLHKFDGKPRFHFNKDTGGSATDDGHILCVKAGSVSSDYILGQNGNVLCPDGYTLLKDEAECRTQATPIFSDRFGSISCHDFAANGCFVDRSAIRTQVTDFSKCAENVYAQKTTHNLYYPVCKKVQDYKYSTTKKNWTAAKDDCEQWGGALAVPENECENAAFMAKAQEKNPKMIADGYYLGISDSVREGTWVSEKTKKEVAFLPWLAKNPNGGTRKNCVAVAKKNDDAKWVDFDCSGAKYYICKKG